jgi:hypothetical protein
LGLDTTILVIFISNQKNAIRWQTIFASSVFLVGVVVMFITHFVDPKSENIKTILLIGGGFISSVSSFPITQIVNRNEKKKIYEGLLKLYVNPTTSKDEIIRIEDFVNEITKKI